MLAHEDPRLPARVAEHLPSPARPAEVHLLDRLQSLYRYRWISATAFLLVLAGALTYAWTRTPMYRATARLLIELEDERSLAMEGVGLMASSWDYYQDPEPYYQTQYRILSGRDLASRVVSTLGADGLQALADRPQEPVGASELAGIVMGRVAVSPVKASNLVDVSFVDARPDLTARVANALAEQYVAQNADLRQQNMTRSLEWLGDELVRQKRLVEASERAMAEYREREDALSLEDRQNIVIDRLNRLNQAATDARTSRAQKESLARQVEALGPSVPADSLPELFQNEFIQSIRLQLAQLERQKALLSERYGNRHPEILTVSASIADTARQLREEVARALVAIRRDYEAARLEEESLAQELEVQKDLASDLDRKSVAYSVLKREAESNRELYQSLLRREKELQVLANSRGNNVRLVEAAAVPLAPFSPDLRRTAILATLVGGLLAVGLALGLDHLDDTVRTPDDVTRKLGLPFLGLIPAVRTPRGQPVLSGPSDFAEAIRSLRTSVAINTTGPGSAIVMVASAQPLEGKTTTACNLATALAHGGARVLLVEADMRRPGVHSAVGLENPSGLSELLRGEAHLTEVVQRLADPDLWVLPAGRTPPNPSELLASGRMHAFMRQVKDGPFDWVIVDTPPVLAVTDASILAPWASTVAFVVGAEMTRRRLAERAVDTLAAGDAPFIGAVLNRVDMRHNRYYYAQQYGYGSYLTAET
jgi:capsular exopolysaccharide synthesis family protein